MNILGPKILMRHLLKPIRMNNSWSSKQHIMPNDLAYLQDVLLALSMKLARKDYNTMGIMTNTTFEDMTRLISTRKMLKDILINLERE